MQIIRAYYGMQILTFRVKSRDTILEFFFNKKTFPTTFKYNFSINCHVDDLAKRRTRQ